MGNAVLSFKNAFGSSHLGSDNLDLQRADLFKFRVNLPRVLGMDWEEHVEFAVEKFPFPARDRESIAVKYLQQVNQIPGGDVATGSVDVTVRYPFAKKTALALEKWHWMVANPRTGGVGLASEVKTLGEFRWLVPASQRGSLNLNMEEGLAVGQIYDLEGCWIKALKPSDADMTSGNTLVTMQMTLQIDRYYPRFSELEPGGVPAGTLTTPFASSNFAP